MKGSGWRLLGWCVALSLVLRPAAAQAPGPAAVDKPPQVSIFGWYSAEMAYQGTVTYSAAAVQEFGVDEQVAKQDLAVLAQGLGYAKLSQLQRVKYGEGPQPFVFQHDKDGLSLGFRLSETAFNRDIGTFKLEAFVVAYRRYGRVDLDFVVTPWNGKAFAYRGLGNFDSRAVVIRHHGNGGSQSFRVAILDTTRQAYELPPFAPPALPLQTAQEGDEDSGPSREQIIVGVVAGALSIAVFLLVFWGLRRWERPRRGRRRGR